jgi:hypothetical protein
LHKPWKTRLFVIAFKASAKFLLRAVGPGNCDAPFACASPHHRHPEEYLNQVFLFIGEGECPSVMTLKGIRGPAEEWVRLKYH